jgi:hypothetical protein
MLIVGGAGREAVSKNFGLHYDALWRHMKNHVSQETRALYIADIPLTELAERAAKEGVSLLDYLTIQRSTLMQLMLQAAGINDYQGAAAISGRLRDVINDIGRFTGEMLRAAPATTVNNTLIINSPIFVDLVQLMLDILGSSPELMAAAVEKIRGLQNKYETMAPALIESKVA